MTLREIINQLDVLRRFKHLRYENGGVESRWSGSIVLEEDTIDIGIEMEELRYFLEVYIAKEVLEVWSQWRNDALPNQEERIRAIVFYASNDAYIG